MASYNSAAAHKRKESSPASTGTETLNFKVTPEFKREFKVYAASRGITMVELLKEGFALSQRRRK